MSTTVLDDRNAGEDSASGIETELSAFQQQILTILSEEARYGLAIKDELEVYYGTPINHGRLYPNLDELVEMDFVEKGELDKRTNEYALTEAGHEAIVDQLSWVFSRFITSESRAKEIEELLTTAQQ